MKYLIPFISALLLMVGTVRAQEPIFSEAQIADAIFRAEGGNKATYLYGIRSVKYSSPEEAREICLRTIRNQKKRHAEHQCGLSYLECLAKRYAPVSAENDPKGLNSNWLNNLKFFLEKTK